MLEQEEHERESLLSFAGKAIPALGIFLLTAWISLDLALWRGVAPLVWPPVGIALFLVLSLGRRYLAVVLVGTFLFPLLAGQGFAAAGLAATGYTLSTAIAHGLFRHFHPGRINLESLRQVTLFLGVGVLLAPVFSSVFNAVVSCEGRLFDCSDLRFLISLHWLSDALGILVVSPFLLVWRSQTRINWRNEQTVEVLVWLALLILLGGLVFRNWAPTDTLRYPMELSIFPVMAWAAIRYGQRGVTAGILIIAMMALWELREVIGINPTRTISQPPGYLWVFVGILSATSLYLAATWTELRYREDQVRTNEERLQAFVQALPDLAMVFEDKGRCTEVFAPVKSPFRNRLSTLRGQNLEEIFPPDLAQIFRQTILEVLRTRELSFVRYAVAINGEDRSFEGRFVPIEAVDQQPPSVMVVSYDLTEGQRVRQDLQRRDQMLNALTQAEAILLKEKVYHRGVRKALGRVGKGLELDMIQICQTRGPDFVADALECTHEWLRESPYVFGSPTFPVGMLDNLRPDWRKELESGESIEFHHSGGSEEEQALLSQIGMRSLILFGIHPKGGVWGMILYGSSLERPPRERHTVSILAAITESLRAYMETRLIQEELESAKEAAVAADHAKSEFLAIMSHEIRTPMNAIIGFSDLLRQTDVSDSQKEYIDIITRSGRDLLELINNILDFSKLESNNVELENRRFPLETTLMEVMEMVLFRAKEKGVAMEFDASEDCDGTFWGDPLRLRQIFLNLLTNAVKFTQKGSVRLKVETLEKDGPWYTFALNVIDTGIGISQDYRGELFQAFRQADSSTTREYGGTGLGLTIVQRLVNKMGGHVGLTSSPGEGSTFRVVIRFKRDVAGADSAVTEVADDGLQRDFASHVPLRILVTEDDPLNTQLIQEILQRLGYEPKLAADGYKALALLAEGRFDMLLLDVQMARMDGLEVTRRIRAGECGERVRRIPVVALTALALAEEKERILGGGVDHYLAKPVGLGELKRMLQSVYQEISGRMS